MTKQLSPEIDLANVCNFHLLQIHMWLHRVAGDMAIGFSVAGWVDEQNLDPQTVHEFHDRVEEEAELRGFRFNSALAGFDASVYEKGNLDREHDIEWMIKCRDCRNRLREDGYNV